MKIADFFAEISITGGEKSSFTLKDLITKMGSLQVATVAEYGSLSALVGKLVAVTKASADAAVAIQDFEMQSGLSGQTLQQWQLAAEQANVSADAVANSLLGLQKNMAEIRMGGGNIKPFQLLGITPNQDAFVVLEKIRERIKNLPRPLATNMLAQFGMDPQMIKLLSMTEDEFRKLAGVQRIMTKDQETMFLQVKMALVQLGQATRAFGYQSAAAFGPHFLSVLQLAKRALDGIMNAFDDLSVFLKASPASITVLAGALGILMLAISPMSFALAGLLLILDDIASYSRGGKSLIGTIMDSGAMKKVESLLSMLDKAGRFIDKMAGPAVESISGRMATANLLTPYMMSKGTGVTSYSVQQTNHIRTNEDTRRVVRDLNKDLREQMNPAELPLNQQGF